jgi:hypothetical protein
MQASGPSKSQIPKPFALPSPSRGRFHVMTVPQSESRRDMTASSMSPIFETKTCPTQVAAQRLPPFTACQP